MLKKTEILLLYEELKEEKELNEQFLIKTLLEYIKEIDEQKIDLNKSRITIEDSFTIRLISTKNSYCNIYLEVLEENVVDIQLNHSGEYLYLQKINSWSDLYNLRSSLEDLLKSEIQEELTTCENKIYKARYTVNHFFSDRVQQQDYIIILGNCFFWKKKETKMRLYKPWLP